jgi:predicted MFS family arabinose efflux permease
MAGPSPLWRNRDYLLLWSGQTVSAVGSQVSGFVLPLLILTLTHSPAQAGISGALGYLPHLLFGVPAGALVDRVDRRRLMIGCEVCRALNMATIPITLWLGTLTIGQLYAISFLEGSLFVLYAAAERTCLVRVVSREQLPGAIAQNETTVSIAFLLGPPLGGALYQLAGRAWPFSIDAASYLISGLSLLFMRTRLQTERETKPGSFRTEVREGFSWLWRHSLLRSILLLNAAGDLLFSGIHLILIVIAKEQMQASPIAIGSIFTVGAIGGMLGSVAGVWIQKRLSFAHVFIGTSWAILFLWPILVAAPYPMVLGAVWAVHSAFCGISNTVVGSYQLALIPDAFQGRVNSLVNVVSYGVLPLGVALTGALLETVGAQRTILCILVCLLLVAVSASLNPCVRRAPPYCTLHAE